MKPPIKIQRIPFYRNALIFRVGTVKQYLSVKEIEENRNLIIEVRADFLPSEWDEFDFFVDFEVLALKSNVKDEPDYNKPILNTNFYNFINL